MPEEQETNLKCEKSTAKEEEAILWDRLSVDFKVPHKIRREVNDKPLILEDLTIIYPETGWVEIIQYKIHRETQ